MPFNKISNLCAISANRLVVSNFYLSTLILLVVVSFYCAGCKIIFLCFLHYFVHGMTNCGTGCSFIMLMGM